MNDEMAAPTVAELLDLQQSAPTVNLTVQRQPDIKDGDPATIEVDGETFHGTIWNVSPTGTFRLELDAAVDDAVGGA